MTKPRMRVDRPRLRTVIVPVLVVLGLATAGCGSGTPTAGPTDADESLVGKKVCVASPIQVETLKEFYDTMKAQAAVSGNGEEIVIADAEGDSTKQHQQFDQFVVQGCDAIVPFLLTTDGWERDVAEAVEKGIGVFNHSASAVTGMTQNVGLSQYDGGYGIGEDAAAWINRTQGGKAQIGILAILNDPQLRLRSEGFRDAIAKLAPDAEIVGEVNAQTKDEGAAAAANLLQAHPGLTVLYAAGDDPGVGALSALTEAGKTSPNEFYLGSTDGTNASFERLGDNGIYQATWSFNFPFSATQLQRDIESFLRGEDVQPTRLQSGTLVTSSNLAEIEAQFADPRAPGVQDLYPEYMKYSDIPMKTGEDYADAFREG